MLKNPKRNPFHIFGTVTLFNILFFRFFQFFLLSPKGAPSFFSYFATTTEFQKARKVPTFRIVNVLRAIPGETEGSPRSVVLDCETFFEKKIMSPKGPPFDFNEAPLVFSGMKRYIRTFDHISELYSVLVRKRRLFENRSLPWKRPTHFSKNVFL